MLFLLAAPIGKGLLMIAAEAAVATFAVKVTNDLYAKVTRETPPDDDSNDDEEQS